jgi:hypothetical protein
MALRINTAARNAAAGDAGDQPDRHPAYGLGVIRLPAVE